MPAYHPGDPVTVLALSDDPILLTMQPQARVARIVDRAAYVHLEAVWPVDEEFGPIPFARLTPGWRHP